VGRWNAGALRARAPVRSGQSGERQKKMNRRTCSLKRANPHLKWSRTISKAGENEIALPLVRFDHVASIIDHADHGVM
jgi:hypothetical protein